MASASSGAMVSCLMLEDTRTASVAWMLSVVIMCWIGAAPIQHMITTDSIQATEAVRISSNIKQLTIAPLLAEAMRRISEESSVSTLFN